MSQVDEATPEQLRRLLAAVDDLPPDYIERLRMWVAGTWDYLGTRRQPNGAEALVATVEDIARMNRTGG